MAYRKYANDFRLEVEQRPDGKAKSVPVYVGPRFVLTAEPAAATRLRRILPLTAFPAAALFAVSLLLNCSITRQIYVILPYFCCFLPYCYLCAAVGGFLMRQPPYTREQNDKIPHRIQTCIIAILLLCAYALVASVVCLIVHSEPVRPLWDTSFLVLLALQLAAAFAVFRKRADLDTREL